MSRCPPAAARASERASFCLMSSPSLDSLSDDVFIRSDLLGMLRAWQREAWVEYFRVPRRDFLLNATPGAGKTAYALSIAAELLARREIAAITVVTPTEHLKHQWAPRRCGSVSRWTPPTATPRAGPRPTSPAWP